MDHISTRGIDLKSEQMLGQIIRKRRRELGLRQVDLASASGVDQANLSRIERGTSSATLDTYLRLCGPLGIDIVATGRGG